MVDRLSPTPYVEAVEESLDSKSKGMSVQYQTFDSPLTIITQLIGKMQR